MGNYSTISKLLTPILLLIVVIGGGFFFKETEKTKKALREERKESQLLKKEQKTTDEAYQQLKKHYERVIDDQQDSGDKQLKEKTTQLFQTVYEYTSDDKKQSVNARKEKAEEFADPSAVDDLFPKDADKVVSTVSTTSKLERDPEIFLMPSDTDEKKALVLIHYAVSIAGSEHQTGEFLYKIRFDSKNNKLTSVQNLGQVDVPS